MGFDYTQIVATARRLVDEYGVAGCTVVRRAGQASDPDKPWKRDVALADEVVLTGISVVMNAEVQRRGSWTAPQALTESGSSRAIAAGDLSAVQPGDFLTVPGSGEHAITSCSRLAPGGEDLIWTIRLRS